MREWKRLDKGEGRWIRKEGKDVKRMIGWG
jgi:hypothetical protein